MKIKGEYMSYLTDWFERNRKWLLFCLASTFGWGMAAHAYRFFSGGFYHDSLNELHASVLGNSIKIGSGRFITPLYRYLLGSNLTLPWLVGMLSLIWIGLTVFFLVKLFHVESKLPVFVIAGVLSTNIAVSATAASYIHDLDSYQFSVMCAALAVLLWRRYDKGWLLGAIPLVVTMGIYQSYLFVAVTLVVMVSILDLVDGRSFRRVFGNGLKAIAMIALGAAGYYAALRGFLLISGAALSTGGYNSLDLLGTITLTDLPRLMAEAYGQTLGRIWNAYSSYPGILVKAATAVLALLTVVSLGAGLRDKGWREILLCLVLVLLLPLLMNFIYVITSGYCHDMMSWPTWFVYVLVLLLCSRLKISAWPGILCMVVVGCLVYGNVQFANGMYLKKDLEYDAYLSLMTRVAARMEENPDYVPGETPVVFVGLPDVMNQVMPGFKDYWNVSGQEFSDVIYSAEKTRYQAYFDYILGIPLLLAEDEVWYLVQSAEKENLTPAYPSPDFLRIQDGILIVKLGNIQE